MKNRNSSDPVKQNTLRAWLKQWDEGNFDFTDAAMGDLHAPRPVQEEKGHPWAKEPVRSIAAWEKNVFDHAFPVFATLLCAVLILFLLAVVCEMPAFGSADTPANTSETIARYVENGLEETGAVNIVAGVILDYRAFDTLGESHVLFTATMAVFLLLMEGAAEREKREKAMILEGDLILRKTAAVLSPLIILFGVYIILNGHLGPGGGFSGGAVIGGGLILYALTFGAVRLNRVLNPRSFSLIVLCALLFYSMAKCYSFFCGANHLETIFTTGTPGAIFSAGLILPLNCAVGLVVACTMYGFYSVFTCGSLLAAPAAGNGEGGQA